MDLRQYGRVLLAHWVLLTLCFVACLGAAAALAWTRSPTYAAEMQLFVTATGRGSLSEDYTGLLLSQQRAVTYSQLITSLPVLQRIDARVRSGGGGSVPNVTASVPSGSSLIDVTVRDRSPRTAKAIADLLAVEFPPYVADLEGAKGNTGRASLVNVHVTKPAELPSGPVAPRKPVYLTLGAVIGVLLGLVTAVLREAFDRRVRAPEDVTSATGLPVVGAIREQRTARRRPLVVLAEPGSARAEEFRRLRTSLELLLQKRQARGLVVASATEAEGKTFVAANLAVAFAQSGAHVVLVDADLRQPQLTRVMGVNPAVGMVEVLADEAPLAGALETWGQEIPLEVLGATERRADAGDLLTPARFDEVLEELTSHADLVIFDAPSLATATDVGVLARSPLLGTILVARSRATRAHELEESARFLHDVDAQVLGVVLNTMRVRRRLPLPWRRRRSRSQLVRGRRAGARRPLPVGVERRGLDG